jgi:hypothetical protein
MDKTDWSRFHTQGWSLVKRWLAARRPTVAESDLTDSTELKETATYATVYFAFKAAEFMSEENKKRAKYWYKRARNSFANAEITVDGVVQAKELFANRRSLRG